MDAEMMQDEAMSMSNEQAIQILKPMRDMMRDQHGCPISDAYFAVDKAIHALQTISPDEVRGVGKWVDKGVRAWSCSCCGTPLNHIRQFASFEKNELPNYCPNCSAKMKGSDD